MVVLPLGQPEAPKFDILKNEQALWTQKDLLGLGVLELKALLQVHIPEFRQLQTRKEAPQLLSAGIPSLPQRLLQAAWPFLHRSPWFLQACRVQREEIGYRQRQNLPWPKVLKRNLLRHLQETILALGIPEEVLFFFLKKYSFPV